MANKSIRVNMTFELPIDMSWYPEDATDDDVVKIETECLQNDGGYLAEVVCDAKMTHIDVEIVNR
jgi:hypothetical protein